MELKNAVAVCVISLFSATLVMLIARSLDSQAASRLEPQLVRIVEELQAIRSSGGIPVTDIASPSAPVRNGLIVYYFHGNVRCVTCEAIESQSLETVNVEFADQLKSGQLVWSTANYEQPAASELRDKFGVHMSVVVLAKMKDGRIDAWNRLDKVWGLVDDKPAFRHFVRTEIAQLLDSDAQEGDVPDGTPYIPLPDDGEKSDAASDETIPLPDNDIPLPTKDEGDAE